MEMLKRSLDSITRGALAASFLALFAGAAYADSLIVGNLTEPIRAATPIANPQYFAAQSFAPDASYDLTTIITLMGNAADADAVVELRGSDALGQIDLSASGLIASFTVPDLTGPAAPRSFTPNAAVILGAGVQYWFVIGVNSGGLDWFYADSNDYAGPGAILTFADSSDAGASWIYGSDFPFFIEVRGDAVPEPAPMLLLALGLGGLLWWGRRGVVARSSRHALIAVLLVAAGSVAASAAPISTSPAPSLVDGFKVEWVQVAEAPTSVADAYDALAGNGFTVLDTFTEYRTPINLSDASAPFSGTDPFFAVRVTGYITLGADDTYTFLSIHDDGIRVVVGGEEVVLVDTATSAIETDSVPFALTAGVYSYEAVGWEQGGGFNLLLGIDSASTGRVFLSGSHAVPEPASPALIGIGLAAIAVAAPR
jgi:hypothetical protein